jgi:hypothetical protein
MTPEVAYSQDAHLHCAQAYVSQSSGLRQPGIHAQRPRNDVRCFYALCPFSAFDTVPNPKGASTYILHNIGGLVNGKGCYFYGPGKVGWQSLI